MRKVYKYNYIYVARDRALSVRGRVRRCEINVGQFAGSGKYYRKTG